MFIRYHCFYYAIACLLGVLGKYFHYLFYISLFFYLIWIYYRLSIYHLLLCLMICCCIFSFSYKKNYQLNENIEGIVEKVNEKYCYVKTDGILIKLYHHHKFHFKDRVSIKVKYLPMNKATNDNAFDEELYLLGQNITLKAQLIEVKQVHHSLSLYSYIEDHLSLKEDVNSYQRLLLFGEKDDNIQNDYYQLTQYSLVHLFALSGMHIHILYILLFSVISLFISKNYAQFITYGLIGYYIFSIPIQISLYRAFFVMVLYDLFKNYFNQLDILSFLMIISFIYNPYFIYNISFVFSYFIYFIVILTKKLKYSFLWIYLSTIPLILNMNYQIPIFSIFIGIFLTPFIEVIYLGSWLSIFFSFGDIFLQLMIVNLQKILNFLEYINFYIQFSKPTLLFVVLYYYIYFSILYCLSFHKKISFYISMMIGLMLSFSIYSQYKIYGEITMIDVGQGDCTLIRLPFQQGNILIDTGGNKDYDLATQTIIPYLKSIGIHYLDYVYISHDDFDHCGALESLIHHFPVKHVIQEYEEYRQIGNIEIEMLKHSYSSDNNDQSLVMNVQMNNYHILWTGDISQNVEKELIDIYTNISVDILKVSHHGSSTATSSDLLDWIHPQVAMIGVKKNNLYHHPSEKVITRLKRKKINILRTDQDGMFHIRFYPYQKYVIYR